MVLLGIQKKPSLLPWRSAIQFPHPCRKEWDSDIPDLGGTEYHGALPSKRGICAFFFPISLSFLLLIPPSGATVILKGLRPPPVSKAYFSCQIIREASSDTPKQQWALSQVDPFIIRSPLTRLSTITCIRAHIQHIVIQHLYVLETTLDLGVE